MAEVRLHKLGDGRPAFFGRLGIPDNTRVCLQSIVFTRNSTKETATETRSYRRKSKGTGSTRLDGQKVPETIQDETSKSPGANDSNRKHRQIHRAEKQLRR